MRPKEKDKILQNGEIVEFQIENARNYFESFEIVDTKIKLGKLC